MQIKPKNEISLKYKEMNEPMDTSKSGNAKPKQQQQVASGSGSGMSIMDAIKSISQKLDDFIATSMENFTRAENAHNEILSKVEAIKIQALESSGEESSSESAYGKPTTSKGHHHRGYGYGKVHKKSIKKKKPFFGKHFRGHGRGYHGPHRGGF